MTATRHTIAGISIPDSALARETTEFVQDVSTQLLFAPLPPAALSLLSLEASLANDSQLAALLRLAPDHEELAEQTQTQPDRGYSSRDAASLSTCNKRRGIRRKRHRDPREKRGA